MANPISKLLIKQFAPQIVPALESGQIELKKYLDSIPLEEGETGCTVILDFKNNGDAVFRVAAFKNAVFSRSIKVFEKTDLVNLISQL